MEENLLYKQEVGGSIPSCLDIHMEWWLLVFGDGGSFDHHQWAYGNIFRPSPMSLWWHFSTLTKKWNGDDQRPPPYICVNNEEHERSIAINHYFSNEIVMVTICHYNHYSWQTFIVTTKPNILATPPVVTFSFFVTKAKVFHHYSYEMVTVTICHYK